MNWGYFAVSFGLPIAVGVLAFIGGWILRGTKIELGESRPDHKPVNTPVNTAGVIGLARGQSLPGVYLGSQGTAAPPAVFKASDGAVLPVRKQWGELPYDEIGPMFLDQFLLRYFHGIIMPNTETPSIRSLGQIIARSPWTEFVRLNPWCKDVPLLFEQLTSHNLSNLQLDNAIADYVSRLVQAAPPLVDAPPIQYHS